MVKIGVVVDDSRHYTTTTLTPKIAPEGVVVVGVSLEHHHTTLRFNLNHREAV